MRSIAFADFLIGVGILFVLEGLLFADHIPEADLVEKYGVREFQTIPVEYLDAGEFRPKAR